MLFTARRYPIAVLAMALCPFVFVSVTVSAISLYGIKTTGRIELVFGIEASFDLSYTVLKKFRYTRRFRYFRLARHEFRHGTSIVAACCQLSSSKQHAYRETPCLHHDSTYTTRLT